MSVLEEGGGWGRKESRMTVVAAGWCRWTWSHCVSTDVDSIAFVAFTDLSQQYNVAFRLKTLWCSEKLAQCQRSS